MADWKLQPADFQFHSQEENSDEGGNTTSGKRHQRSYICSSCSIRFSRFGLVSELLNSAGLPAFSRLVGLLRSAMKAGKKGPKNKTET
jgi:hypothetical protein